MKLIFSFSLKDLYSIWWWNIFFPITLQDCHGIVYAENCLNPLKVAVKSCQNLQASSVSSIALYSALPLYPRMVLIYLSWIRKVKIPISPSVRLFVVRLIGCHNFLKGLEFSLSMLLSEHIFYLFSHNNILFTCHNSLEFLINSILNWRRQFISNAKIAVILITHKFE